MTDEERNIVESVYRKAFIEADTARKPREPKWLNYYKLYRSYIEARNDGKANLFIPYTFSLVETVLPRITRTLFANRPYIGVVPRNRMSVGNAPVMESYIDYVWNERMNIPYKAHNWIKQCLIYGYSPAKVTWKKKVVQKQVNKPNYFMNIPLKPFMLGYMPQVEEQIVYNAPEFQLIDIFDFWLDPLASCIEDARYCIQRTTMTRQEIEQMAEKGIFRNVEELLEEKGTALAGENKERRLSLIGLGGGANVEYEGVFTIDEYWEDGRVITVGNERILLRDDPNPFWHGKKPFVELVDQPVPFESYPIGEIEPIEVLQYELNDMRNQRMDNVNLTLNKMWMRRRNADISDEDLVSRPGGIVDVDDIERDLRPIDFDHVTGNSYQEEVIVKQDIQNATGVFDHVRGLPSDREDTATEVMRLQQSAEARFYEKIMVMESIGFKKLAELTCALAQQFVMDTNDIPLITGDQFEFLDVTPETVAGQYDFITMSTSMDSLANRDTKRQSLTELYGMIAGDPLLNRFEFLKSLFKAYDIREVDRLLINPVQMQQMMPPTQPGEGGPSKTPLGGGRSAYYHNERDRENIRQGTMEGLNG